MILRIASPSGHDPGEAELQQDIRRSRIMNFAQKILALSTLVGGLAAAEGLQAAELASGLTMKPLHSVSFDLGTRRAAGYFLIDNGQCRLVLTVAEAPDRNDASRFAATRFEVAIRPGNATQYNSTEGVAIEFACQANAEAMTVETVGQVAVAPIE
jgi:hypothetical protein